VLQPHTQLPSGPDKVQNTDSSSNDALPLADSFGRISLEKSETTYVESTHWTAILDEVCCICCSACHTSDIMRGFHADMSGPQIAELRDYFQESHDRSEQQASSTLLESNELIFGHCKYMSKQEILATVPPRQFVDRLVASFFNYETAAPGSS
jgi:hypothetical protein